MLDSPNDLMRSMAGGQQAYTDLQGLNKINQLADKDQDLALKEMAKQFESLFMNIMLKSMRDANAVFEEDGLFNSSEMEFHRDMFDQQLSLTLSEQGGIGLADTFYRQMQQQYPGQAASSNPSLPAKSHLSPVGQGQSAETTKQNTPVDFSLDQVETPEDFLGQLYPHAKQAAEKLGVEPEVLLAQSALETGWGKYVARDSHGRSTHNLFNIKADQRWSGPRVAVSTLEYRDSQPQRETANFRSYGSVVDSFNDYVDFIATNSRYREALKAESADDYVNSLQAAGYATDPAYADKVLRLYHSDAVQQIAGNPATPRG